MHYSSVDRTYTMQDMCQKQVEKIKKSQKTEYLSTAIKPLSTDVNSQQHTSSGKQDLSTAAKSPVDRSTQSENQCSGKTCTCRQQQ
ncbi:hypothetical protein Taro_035435, partial [Colocasia esculenta]|nr:hypothetical protein [Colocasia esculenta]